jgi:LuxR family maltose regulon positive regulatory protein
MIGSAMTAWGEPEGGVASAQWLGRGATVRRLASTADEGGVAVIAAEAGTGKTALVRQWVATRPHNGVHMADVTTADGVEAALAHFADGATVVVDHAEHVEGERLAQLAAVERGPGSALIVVGRRDPLLAETQLELAGQDLAWSPPEVVEALRRWGRPISDEEADQIAWISEGWCAAVRLAAVAGAAVLREESAALQYQLMRDAAATVSPELLTAAIELSAVDQFDARTVDALLDPPDGGAALIDELVRNRLFVRPTKEPGVWRFHRLFLRAARHELRSGPTAAAARWPEHATRDPAGVSRWFRQHAQQSSLTDDMLESELLAAHAVELLLEGALEPPSPAALMRASSRSPLGRSAIALAALAAGDLGAAEFAHDDPRAPRDPVSGELAAVSELLRARHAGVLGVAVAAAESLAATAPDDGHRALAWLELGTLEVDLGEGARGEEHLKLAASLADHAQRPALAARAWAALAMHAASAGRLMEADEFAEMVERTRSPSPEAAVRSSLARASVAFQRDDLDEAVRHADIARLAVGGSWDPVLSVYVLTVEIAILDAQGRDALAAARLAEADDVLARCPDSLYHVTTLELYRARLLERAGREHEAERVRGGIDQPGHPALVLAEARGHLYDDDPAAALAILRPCLEAPGLFPEELSPWHLLLYAMAVDRLGDADSAHDALERALALAESAGARRAFVDEGLAVRRLLEEHLDRTTAHAAFVSELLDHIDARRPAPDGELRAPLTEREVVVLGYLPSEMTARDIAAALTVSETTVRTHLRHIYEKLDADGRRHAVRRARELRLLSPQ